MKHMIFALKKSSTLSRIFKRGINNGIFCPPVVKSTRHYLSNDIFLKPVSKVEVSKKAKSK
jgi:hypothetical protein